MIMNSNLTSYFVLMANLLPVLFFFKSYYTLRIFDFFLKESRIHNCNEKSFQGFYKHVK